jgi:hypothetical protein
MTPARTVFFTRLPNMSRPAPPTDTLTTLKNI